MFAAIAVPCASRLRAGFFFALVPASAMPNNANLEVEMLRRGMFRNHRLDRRSGAAAAYASPITMALQWLSLGRSRSRVTASLVRWALARVCAARALSDSNSGFGRVAEWFKAPVLKFRNGHAG